MQPCRPANTRSRFPFHATPAALELAYTKGHHNPAEVEREVHAITMAALMAAGSSRNMAGGVEPHAREAWRPDDGGGPVGPWRLSGDVDGAEEKLSEGRSPPSLPMYYLPCVES